jgi:small subunit ribosomal protein S3
MGQKVNPIGLRLGINRTWDSRWYADSGEYGRLLHQDLKIRKMLREKLAGAGISRIIIERPLRKCRVTIFTAKPGVVIGKKGADIEKLRKDLGKMSPGSEVFLNLVEVRKPETDAMLVAEGITQQLERRVAFRRAMKRAMQSAMRLGAQGIRINVSGRLGGAEIARMEWYREGRVPLHTLRADVDFGFSEAKTAYGQIGCKVWIFKGEILEHDPMAQDRRAQETGEQRERRDRDGPRGPRDDRGGRDDRRGPRRPRRDDQQQPQAGAPAPSGEAEG